MSVTVVGELVSWKAVTNSINVFVVSLQEVVHHNSKLLCLNVCLLKTKIFNVGSSSSSNQYVGGINC